MSNLNDKVHPCPLCAKAFKTKSAVQNHMNQKASYCRHYFDNVMHFGTQPLDSSIAESEGGGPSANDLEIDFVAEAMLMDMDVQVVQDNLDVELPENAAHFHSNQPNLQSSSFHIEYYPGAAEIKSKEKTFMDIFDNDEHASKRCSNLYYSVVTVHGTGMFLGTNVFTEHNFDPFVPFFLS